MRNGYDIERLVLTYEIETAEAFMRVSDRVLKCVVFLGAGKGKNFKPYGTGFLVIIQAGAVEFQYIVTAAHIVVGSKEPIVVRINKRNGEPDYITPPRGWFYHPDHERFVDVAVAPIILHPYTYDIVCIRTREFCKETTIAARDVGIGDELFYPGLFLHYRGFGRNHPVMRFGMLSAMPTEPVTTKSGPIKAYLMEGRSIGGHSGSPVFINFMAPRSYHAEHPVPLQTPAEAMMPYRLLGLIYGFLRAKDSGEYVTDEPLTEDLWVNSGISAITPSTEIIDVLMQDELKDQRMADDRKLKDSLAVPATAAPTDVSETSDDANPNHLADFTRLVDVAARKRPQDDQT